QVALWLKKIYGHQAIPEYEVNERTVDILHDIMEYNEANDRDASFLIENMKEEVTEYEEEAKHMQNVLIQSLGLNPASLSRESFQFFSDLVDSAVTLEMKDTSLSSFFCAINDMTSELFETESQNKEIALKLKNIRVKLSAALMLELRLQKDLAKAKKYLEIHNSKAKTRSKNKRYLINKTGDLKCRIKTAEEELIALGLDQALTHKDLAKQSEELVALQKNLKLLKKKLKYYHDLPPVI
ncbi:HAUS augmin-like complex subunit 1, partial [Acanthisitta chloris]